MDTFRFGEVSNTRVVEIGRSFYPTTSMLPESTPEAIARHHGGQAPLLRRGHRRSRFPRWALGTVMRVKPSA